MSLVKIELLSGALGAEITGIDLRDTSDNNFKIINDLLLEHKVIFFHDQNISHQEQIDIAKCFGPIEHHAYVKGLPDYPEILRIVKEPFEKNNWGENWHSDVSYNPEPTQAVILKSVEIPPIGGDTMFANMELAWETLDEKLKNKPGTSRKLIKFVKDRAGHDMRYAIDATKIKNDLGWEPSVTFDQGLEKTVEWYLNNKEWLEHVTSGAYLEYYSKQYSK